MDRIPCSASAAELAHDRSRRAPSDRDLERALDDVVDQVMQGKSVPHGRQYDCIDLHDFLDSNVGIENQTDDYVALLTASNDEAIMRLGEQRRTLEAKLRAHLAGSAIVQERAAEIDREDAESAAARQEDE
jgi:hypothetical protein